MTALHCPATLLLAGPAEGLVEARELAGSVRHARVARVYSGAGVAAVRTADVVAAGLGVQAEVRDRLGEWSPDEGAAEVLARITAELEEIADQHPGETVLVVSHDRALAYAVPWLAENLPGDFAARHPLRGTALVEAAIDADGCRVRSWAGVDVSAETGEYA